MRYTILALLPSLCLAVEVEAAKLATPDAMPIDPGAYEVGVGLDWSRSTSYFDGEAKLNDRDGTAIGRQVSLSFAAGIVEHVDAAIALGYARLTDGSADPDSGSGLTDVTVGARWQFLKNEHLALAVIPELSIPVGDGNPDEEISTGSHLWGASMTVAATASIDQLALGAALSRGWVVGRDQDRGDERGSFGADLAVGWQLTEVIQPEVELHYVRDIQAEDILDPYVVTVTVGVLASTAYGRFGVGVDQAIDGKNTDRTTTVTLQWVKGF